MGTAAAFAWRTTDDLVWIHAFFSYAGAPFLAGCALLQFWVSFRCWKQFSPGDLLRPAWFLITLSALAQFAGSSLTHLLGAAYYAPIFSPIYMLFLAAGLFYVLQACRQNGILGGFRVIDIVLLAIVATYTINFFATTVFTAQHHGKASTVQRILNWTSDPLLCLLLFEAILIRRSIANMGWGLVSRCWLSFTAAIFLTSVGDIGLWAWAKGYLPHALEIASWYVWFLAGAAFALGPAYQLQALLHVTSRVPQPDIRGTTKPLQTSA